jgi:hypothetical protein
MAGSKPQYTPRITYYKFYHRCEILDSFGGECEDVSEVRTADDAIAPL